MKKLSVYPRRKQGLDKINARWGYHDPVRVYLHHSAGPNAWTRKKTIALAQSYDEHHYRLYGGGFAYNVHVDTRGRIYRGRGIHLIGSGVGGNNTGSFHVMLHGDFTKRKANYRQRRALRKLYRGRVKGYEFLKDLPWFGHKEGPGQSTACPGSLLDNLNKLRRRWPR